MEKTCECAGKNNLRIDYGRETYSFSEVFAMKLIDLNKRYIEWWQRKLGISDYALLWVSFIKGILIALLVIWLVK